jgi:hypothetical protein
MFGHMWGDSLKNRPQLLGTSNQSELPTCAGQNDDPKIWLKAAVQVGGTPEDFGRWFSYWSWPFLGFSVNMLGVMTDSASFNYQTCEIWLGFKRSNMRQRMRFSNRDETMRVPIIVL